jgi:hypothetical protein
MGIPERQRCGCEARDGYVERDAPVVAPDATARRNEPRIRLTLDIRMMMI